MNIKTIYSILGVVIIGIGAYYLINNVSSGSPENQLPIGNNSDETNAPPTNESDSWEVYTNEKIGISVQLPSNLKIQNQGEVPEKIYLAQEGLVNWSSVSFHDSAASSDTKNLSFTLYDAPFDLKHIWSIPGGSPVPYSEITVGSNKYYKWRDGDAGWIGYIYSLPGKGGKQLNITFTANPGWAGTSWDADDATINRILASVKTL
ncbi:MAG: hypothetical protein WCW55_03260 [Patescibacteria group bacterium]